MFSNIKLLSKWQNISYSASTWSWQVKTMRITWPFTCNCHGTCFNQSHAWRSLPYLKFGVNEAWESTETENTIHFEWYNFHIFHILACPVALVSTWVDIEIPVTPCFFLTSSKWEILHFPYCKFNTAICNELPTQRECTIAVLLMLKRGR